MLELFKKMDTRHTLWKLVDKMRKYEMHPANIVEGIERARFGWQTDVRMDGQMSTSLTRGIKILVNADLKWPRVTLPIFQQHTMV